VWYCGQCVPQVGQVVYFADIYQQIGVVLEAPIECVIEVPYELCDGVEVGLALALHGSFLYMKHHFVGEVQVCEQ